VVGHDAEVMELEAVGSDAGAKDIDEQSGVAVRLEEAFFPAGLGGDKEGAIGLDNVGGIGIAGRDGHRDCSGAKADPYFGVVMARLKAVPLHVWVTKGSVAGHIGRCSGAEAHSYFGVVMARLKAVPLHLGYEGKVRLLGNADTIQNPS